MQTNKTLVSSAARIDIGLNKYHRLQLSFISWRWTSLHCFRFAIGMAQMADHTVGNAPNYETQNHSNCSHVRCCGGRLFRGERAIE